MNRTGMNRQLLRPSSIVVVGGSGDVHKPGGKVLKNLLDGAFGGKLYVVNPRGGSALGVPCHEDIDGLPEVELAILAIAARHVPGAVKKLAAEKGTRAFIVLSAGFSESGPEGKALEEELVAIVDGAGGVLIGPNSIGVLTPWYHGVFTEPIPKLDPGGCDLISGSGATAVFLLEAGIPKGLTFSSVFSVGNSAQVGVEDVLAHLDETFDPAASSRVKLLYLERMDRPRMLLEHARSLVRKGCRIAAIKAGSSEAGSRAASSHTGALASPDVAVDALFRKAGIVRCHSREELVQVACVLRHPEMTGKNIAVITHAGGPAVMATDALSRGGLCVPAIPAEEGAELLRRLFPGSSVHNPIDFLATGTAEQLGGILDHVERLPSIDAMVVIFGTPGLVEVWGAYEVIHRKKRSCRKPIFAVMPSALTARREMAWFLSQGEVCFPDEVLLAEALCKVADVRRPAAVTATATAAAMDDRGIREVIEGATGGYLEPGAVMKLAGAAGIPMVRGRVVNSAVEALEAANEWGYPLVMKAVGPVHKTEVGGVSLDVRTGAEVTSEYGRLLGIEGATGVLVQPMLKGVELFLGAKWEPGFGHVILCGLGGIFVEALNDVASGLAPLVHEEALDMIRRLRGYPLLRGVRGQPGVDEDVLAELLVRLSRLVAAAPELREVDVNPLLGCGARLTAVDARIRVEKR